MRKRFRKTTFNAGSIGLAEIAIALKYVIKKGGAIGGRYIHEFERRFREYLGAKHAISFGSDRMALFFILKAMRIGSGDEIILPAYTCVVVPNAVRHAGAKPVYADIDPNEIEIKMTDRTKAVIVQHTYGVPQGFMRFPRL